MKNRPIKCWSFPRFIFSMQLKAYPKTAYYIPKDEKLAMAPDLVPYFTDILWHLYVVLSIIYHNL